MTTFPIMLEQRPPGPATDDESGLSAPRQFSVLATSSVAAILYMRQQGIYRGAPYRDPWGGVPDPFCLCQRVTAIGKPPAINGGAGQYIVTAEYSRKQFKLEPQPGGRTIWYGRSSLSSVPLDVDAYGDPVATSAGQVFDPPGTATMLAKYLRAEFYYAAPDSITALTAFKKWENTINLKPFKGGEMGCLKCHPFEANETDTGWIRMGVNLEYTAPRDLSDKRILDRRSALPWEISKFPGWVESVLDRGNMQLDASRKLVPVTDPATNIQTEQALNGGGQTQNTDATTVLIAVYRYKPTDFNEIPFP